MELAAILVANDSFVEAVKGPFVKTGLASTTARESGGKGNHRKAAIRYEKIQHEFEIFDEKYPDLEYRAALSRFANWLKARSKARVEKLGYGENGPNPKTIERALKPILSKSALA